MPATPQRRIRKISADDVARMAQVSRSAVSRTFTPGASVAPDTRARILTAASALGYRPAGYAANANSARQKRAAIIMANLYSPYFSNLYSMIEAEFNAREFEIVWRIISDGTQVDATIEDLIAQDIDGILVLSAVPGPQARKKVVAANISLVVLERQDTVEGAALVWIDGPEIGRSVAQLMAREDRQRPAAIAENPQGLTELASFSAAMEAAGSAPCRWINTGWTYEHGVTAARQLFAQNPVPDAIFAASDYLAMGLVDTIRHEFGLRVPQDVSVIGFGDTSQSRWMSHPTSSVHLPLMSLVQTAVATMISRLGPTASVPPRIWLACDIVERGTTLGLSHPEGPVPSPPGVD